MEAEIEVGGACRVKQGRKLYNGKIAAIGSEKKISELEGKFELNEWTPPALCDEHTAKQAKSGKENVKKTAKKRKQASGEKNEPKPRKAKDVGTIIEVQQHIIAAKPVETTASTSQVKPAATEVGSPAPQVVELLTSESETSSPQKRVHTGPPAEESASSSSPSKTSIQKSSRNLRFL